MLKDAPLFLAPGIVALVVAACGHDADSPSAATGADASTPAATGSSVATTGAGGNGGSDTTTSGTGVGGGAGGVGGAGGGEAILFSDDFNRPDTAGVLDNGWITNVLAGNPLSSTFEIDNERAFPFFGSTASGPFLSTVPMAFRPEPFADSHIRVAADLIAEGGDYDGLALLFARSEASTNMINNTYFCGFLAAAKKLYLAMIDDGVLVALAISQQEILPLPQGSTSRLTFTLEGADLSCAVEGPSSVALAATDATFAAGYFGMAGGKPNANRIRFDDFVLDRP
jgi:hypothetical protein